MKTERSSTWKRRSTLAACFVHFDLSFMLWVMLGALGIPLAETAQLSPSQKGLVVALPILSGSLLRVPVGLLADRWGGKRVGVMLLAFLFVPLTLAATVRPTLGSLLAIGAMLGTAGASFAVALPLASRWFPPDRQGLALGIAAAGNSGTVITNLIAPRLAAAYGIPTTFSLAMALLAVVLIVFAIFAHEPPVAARPRHAFPSLRDPDLWWLCLFYAITFGGYVGLSSFLPLLLRDQYGLSAIHAGYCTAAIAFLGSAARPVGGIIADRIGGARLLSVLLLPIALFYGVQSMLPSLPFMVVLLGSSMICLGLGNGAVFQIVPQRFRREIGAVTGLIGAVGGVGGFVLPNLLGGTRQQTGSFSLGFLGLAALAALAAVVLRTLTAPSGKWSGISIGGEAE